MNVNGQFYWKWVYYYYLYYYLLTYLLTSLTNVMLSNTSRMTLGSIACIA